MKNFTKTTMFDIYNILRTELTLLEANAIIEFEVINPDLGTSSYAGTHITLSSEEYIYYSYKSWTDLANILKCKMLTPSIHSKNTIQIRLKKLNEDVSFHLKNTDKEEKYGSKSIFSQIYKMQEPAFLHYYLQALKNVNVDKRLRILNLGVNSGDEFELIKEYAQNFSNLELVGIDYCSSAIEEAKTKFENENNIQFFTHDINDLDSLNLDKFDLIISIGTLQSSNLDFNPLLMSIVQNQLKPDGAMILGFPNCRWLDGEMIYGARAKHYAFSEMSNVYKDAIFAKKYLQQKKFRVSITGKEYIFLTATSIRKD